MGGSKNLMLIVRLQSGHAGRSRSHVFFLLKNLSPALPRLGCFCSLRDLKFSVIRRQFPVSWRPTPYNGLLEGVSALTSFPGLFPEKWEAGAGNALLQSFHLTLYTVTSLTQAEKVTILQGMSKSLEFSSNVFSAQGNSLRSWRDWCAEVCRFPRGHSWEFLVGVCRPVLQILTLFQTKKWHFPHLLSDLASKIHTHSQTWPLRNYVIITYFSVFPTYFGIETINTFAHSRSSLETITDSRPKW